MKNKSERMINKKSERINIVIPCVKVAFIMPDLDFNKFTDITNTTTNHNIYIYQANALKGELHI